MWNIQPSQISIQRSLTQETERKTTLLRETHLSTPSPALPFSTHLPSFPCPLTLHPHHRLSLSLLSSHHVRSFSRRCGMLSLISVSRSSNSTLLARLLLLALPIPVPIFSPATIALLLRGLCPPSSPAWNVERGLARSFRRELRGLCTADATRE